MIYFKVINNLNGKLLNTFVSDNIRSFIHSIIQFFISLYVEDIEMTHIYIQQL